MGMECVMESGGCVKRIAYCKSLQGRNATGMATIKNCMSGQQISFKKIPLSFARLLNTSNTKKIGSTFFECEIPLFNKSSHE